MTHLLLAQVCQRHLITKTHLMTQDTPLAREAREDFIRTAHKNGWRAESIARELGCPTKQVEYTLQKVIGQAPDGPTRSVTEAAEPRSFDAKRLHTGPAADPFIAVQCGGHCMFIWSTPEGVEVPA